ncbi:hypothetical protein ACFQZ4_06575 [Catellatospora coxensis]
MWAKRTSCGSCAQTTVATTFHTDVVPGGISLATAFTDSGF